MDAYKKLQLEYKGIRNVILKYTNSGNMINHLDGLEEGIQNNEIDNVLYYLNEICTWYRQNINDIHANGYVYNKSEHDRNKSILEEVKNELDMKYQSGQLSLTQASSQNIKYKNNVSPNSKCPKIFLSHRSSDKKYGDALEKIIMGLGVKEEQLIYTSHPLHKIPLNENIYDYLRKNINQNVFVIILWSNEYLESPACLNEMGAAWVTQSDYINIYTPDFAFGSPKYRECAVDTRKMGAVLNGDANCKASIIEFRDKILELFGMDIDEQKWTYLLDQFISDIK